MCIVSISISEEILLAFHEDKNDFKNAEFIALHNTD